jgi:hypothetical protein
VSTYCITSVDSLGDPYLCPNTIYSRNDYRILESCRPEVEQTTKSSDFSIGARPSCRFNKWLDSLNQGISSFNRDAGGLVCKPLTLGLISECPGNEIDDSEGLPVGDVRSKMHQREFDRLHCLIGDIDCGSQIWSSGVDCDDSPASSQ